MAVGIVKIKDKDVGGNGQPGVSQFADLLGNARDNVDLNSELDQKADAGHSHVNVGADNVSGQTLATPTVVGQVFYLISEDLWGFADNTDKSRISPQIGICSDATLGTIMFRGVLPITHSFATGARIFVGVNGALTDNVNTNGLFLRQVGYIDDANDLRVDISEHFYELGDPDEYDHALITRNQNIETSGHVYNVGTGPDRPLSSLTTRDDSFLNVKDAGAKGDAIFYDEAITVTATSMQTATVHPTSIIGKTVMIRQADTANYINYTFYLNNEGYAPFRTKILNVSGNIITLEDPCPEVINEDRDYCIYTDDTVAIQRAIDYFADQYKGGTIWFPNGFYGISDTIRINSSGIKLIGTNDTGAASVYVRAPTGTAHDSVNPNSTYPQSRNSPLCMIFWVGPHGGKTMQSMIHIKMPWDTNDKFGPTDPFYRQRLRGMGVENLAIWGAPYRFQESQADIGLRLTGGVYYSDFCHLDFRHFNEACLQTDTPDQRSRTSTAQTPGETADVAHNSFYRLQFRVDRSEGYAFWVRHIFDWGIQCDFYRNHISYLDGSGHSDPYKWDRGMRIDWADHNVWYKTRSAVSLWGNDKYQNYFETDTGYQTQNVAVDEYFFDCGPIRVIDTDPDTLLPYRFVPYGIKIVHKNENESGNFPMNEIGTSPQASGIEAPWNQPNSNQFTPSQNYTPTVAIETEDCKAYNQLLLTFDTPLEVDSDYFDLQTAPGTGNSYQWTVNFDRRHNYKVTVIANWAVSLTSPTYGAGEFTLHLVDANLWALTWPVNVNWQGGSEFTWTGNDIIKLYWDGINDWYIRKVF